MLGDGSHSYPITRTSVPSLIYFSKLLPFHHQDYRAISELFQQAYYYQVACWEMAAIPTTITRTSEPSMIYFYKFLFLVSYWDTAAIPTTIITTTEPSLIYFS
jgi:hypothetical protein